MTLEQAIAPRVTPPGPIKHMVRHMCARVLQTMVDDLRIELQRRQACEELASTSSSTSSSSSKRAAGPAGMLGACTHPALSLGLAWQHHCWLLPLLLQLCRLCLWCLMQPPAPLPLQPTCRDTDPACCVLYACLCTGAKPGAEARASCFAAANSHGTLLAKPGGTGATACLSAASLDLLSLATPLNITIRL